MKYLLCLLVLLFSVQATGAQESSMKPSSNSDDRKGQIELIESCIKSLNSNSYASRKTARSQLVQIGTLAISPLLELVESQDAQLSFAAVEILKDIALSSDLDILEKILRTSNNFSEVTRNRFSQWSTSALDEWKTAQIERAAARIAKLGATVSTVQAVGGLDMIFLNDVEQQVKTVKRSAPDMKNVLKEIQELKDIQEGNSVKKKQDTQVKAAAEASEGLSIVVVNGRRLLIDRAGRMIDLDGQNDDSQYSGPPQNVTIGDSWTGGPDGINELRMMFNLGKLEFVEKKITKQYLDAILKLPSVKSITFTRCKYSMDEVREFRTKLEKSKLISVTATGAGYLGVYGPSGGEPADGTGSFVSMVSPESAAQEAGLQRGDVIFKVDDDEITSFSDLSLAISSKQVATPVRLMIRRDGAEKEMVVKLKSRAEIIP